MKKVRLFTLLLSLLASITSCTLNNNTKKPADAEQAAEVTFTLPQIPAMLTEPTLRATFLAQHYWDHFPFNDTTYLHLPDVTEQALVNFMDILKHIDSTDSKQALYNLLKSSSVNQQYAHYFWNTLSRYWYDPNSPLRNEPAYIEACEAAIELKEHLDPAILIRAEYDLVHLSKNQVGKIANDISFVTANQQKRTLHELQADYTLLYFYNPGCETCEELKQYIIDSEFFTAALKQKELQIVAIYPDQDIEEWRANLATMPTDWIVGYDPAQLINEKQLYYIQAIPTFYLLNKEKIVYFKDAMIQQIEQFIKNKSL